MFKVYTKKTCLTNNFNNTVVYLVYIVSSSLHLKNLTAVDLINYYYSLVKQIATPSVHVIQRGCQRKFLNDISREK